MTDRDLVPQVLPASTRSLSAGVPPAPPGTIFVLAADGGYRVPPRRFTLLFGRGGDDVHVAVGVNDPYVSRKQGFIEGDGSQWRLRNEGRLPLQLPGGSLLLSSHEMVLPAGYTPLFIGQTKRHSRLLEVHVVSPLRDSPAAPVDQTRLPPLYELSQPERMVLTALAQRYLRQERHPQPVSWKQVAEDLNRLPNGRTWTQKTTANAVEAVRKRLADQIPGLIRDDEVGEPVGNVLNRNLILALLESSTLMPEDLRLVFGDEE